MTVDRLAKEMTVAEFMAWQSFLRWRRAPPSAVAGAVLGGAPTPPAPATGPNLLRMEPAAAAREILGASHGR